MSDEILVEAQSLQVLAEIEKEAETLGLRLALIGGYAVRAYTKRRSWRFTKDMDFVTPKKDIGGIKTTLKKLGFSFEETDFGFKGSKKAGKNGIKLDIAPEKIIDWTSGKEYAIPDDSFEKAVQKPILAAFEENKAFELEALVAPVEDVVAMKLITTRPRDHFDVAGMLLDSSAEFDSKRFAKIIDFNSLGEHCRKRLEEMLSDIKNGNFRKVWRQYAFQEITFQQERELKKVLLGLLENRVR